MTAIEPVLEDIRRKLRADHVRLPTSVDWESLTRSCSNVLDSQASNVVSNDGSSTPWKAPKVSNHKNPDDPRVRRAPRSPIELSNSLAGALPILPAQHNDESLNEKSTVPPVVPQSSRICDDIEGHAESQVHSRDLRIHSTDRLRRYFNILFRLRWRFESFLLRREYCRKYPGRRRRESRLGLFPAPDAPPCSQSNFLNMCWDYIIFAMSWLAFLLQFLLVRIFCFPCVFWMTHRRRARRAREIPGEGFHTQNVNIDCLVDINCPVDFETIKSNGWKGVVL